MAIFCRILMLVAAVLASGGVAYAKDGQPAPWQIGFQRANTPIMDQITSFHTYVTIIITLIALFVLGLLIYVMQRFNENTNPLPSRTSHNTPIEVAWTVIPILILVAIAIPSFRLLFAQYDFPKPDLTITATGSQWYWTYDYPDHGIHFDSIIVQDADLKQDQPRLLSVDHEVVVPVGKNIRVLQTSTDVIHSWFVPSLGVQRYAIPGRTIETWFKVDKPGVFYGECNQICGTNHSRMPIVVRGVTPQEFDAWLNEAKTKFSDAAPVADPAKASEPRLLAAAGVQH